MNTRKRRMLILSLDAVGSRDIERARNLPGFSRFFEGAGRCMSVNSVYPSITYPAHTTIVTGRTPCHHGVIDNTKIQPGRKSPDWYWQRKYIRGTTLYDEAMAQGMTTAALLWPVTARSKITYNVPEIFANRPWTNQILTSLWNGTPMYQFRLNQRFRHLRDGIRQPELDNFTQASLIDTLKKYQPDLTLVHFTDVDTQKHDYGNTSEEGWAAMVRHSRRLEEIQDTLEALGLAEDTIFVLLGDHSQQDVKQIICLNELFFEKGWMTVKCGKIKQWQVYAKSCDGSAYIYVKEQRLKRPLYALLKKLREEKRWGIKALYTGKHAAKMGADAACAFMLEAEDGFFFRDDVAQAAGTGGGQIFDGPVYVRPTRPGEHKGCHGYRPEKSGYQTFFAMKGPGVRKNQVISQMTLADEGPTLAALLGLDLGETDGKVIDAFLEKE